MNQKKISFAHVMLPYAAIAVVVVLSLAMLVQLMAQAGMQEFSAAAISSVQYHMGMIDDAITTADDMMNEKAANDPNMVSLMWCDNEDVYMLYCYRVWHEFGKHIYSSPVVGSYFFRTTLVSKFFQVAQGEDDYTFRNDAGKIISEMLDKNELNEGWNRIEVNGETVLVRLVEMQNMLTGYWVRESSLLSGLTSDDSHVIYTLAEPDNAGEKNVVMSRNGLFGIKADMSNVRPLSLLTARSRILIALCFLVVSICIFWLCAGYAGILHPVGELISTMEQVSSGNNKARVKIQKHSVPVIGKACTTFNSMMDYTEEMQQQLSRQQVRLKESELEIMRLQINPHFFINALSAVRNYAAIRNYKVITDMVMYLSDYFRFVLRPGVTVVTLMQEKQHTDNYMHIQQVRFGSMLQFNENFDEKTLNCKVPILILHTFADNCVAHSGESSLLKINISATADEESSTMEIVVEDNGAGFDNAALKSLNAGISMTDDVGKHVGISNLTERMAALYGKRKMPGSDDGSWKIIFSNSEYGGGKITMTVPMLREDV